MLRRILFGSLVCLIIAITSSSCVIQRGGSCTADSECEAFHVCFREWCMPATVRDRLLKRLGQRGDAGTTDAPDQAQPKDAKQPENPADTPVNPDDPCASACKLNTFETCYPEKTVGCVKKGNAFECTAGCKAGQRFCVSTGGQCPEWTTCRNATTPELEECNGKDDDCDGIIDEGSDDNPLSRSCYGGKDGTEGVGICRAGTQTCGNSKWGECKNEVQPDQKEACGNGKDDNCNGSTDEDCVCTPGKQQDCGASTTGECKKGKQTCQPNGKWGTCEGEVTPKKEECNGKDDDCDGTNDNGFQQECYEGPSGTADKGICKKGARLCVKGKVGACQGQITPQTEICNGKDDDCDGTIDKDAQNNKLKRSCYSGPLGSAGKGICKKGTQTCENGAWTSCTGEVVPVGTKDSCNGKDDNCDGTPNGGCACTDGQKKNCGSNSTGACKIGQQACSGGTWGSCVGRVDPKTETCNGIDDNCDGTVDGMTRACNSSDNPSPGVGLCRGGTQTCNAGNWTPCSGETKPTTETCDNKDNDCDGAVDESVTRACYTGTSGTVGKGPCKQGTQSCTGGQWGNCSGEVKDKPEETCLNGIDDDCDGKVDNGCVTTFAGTGVRGYKDGDAAQAQFGSFGGMAVDAKGDVYIAEGSCIRRIYKNAQGKLWVETFAGDCNVGGETNGNLLQARFSKINGLAINSTGNLYVSDDLNNCIREIDLTNKKVSDHALSCDSSNPFGERPGKMAIDKSNNIYFISGLSQKSIEVINAQTKQVTNFASATGGSISDKIHSLSIDPSNQNLYFEYFGCIYKANLANKSKVVFAGSCGNRGYTEGDLLTQAKFSNIGEILFLSNNEALITEESCIRRIDFTKKTTSLFGGDCTKLGDTNNVVLLKARFRYSNLMSKLNNTEVVIVEWNFIHPPSRIRKLTLP